MDRQLFLDDFWIDHAKVVERRLHQPVPREIAIASEKPWEGRGVCYMVAFPDGDGYRGWYRCDPPGGEVDAGSGYTTAAADGTYAGAPFGGAKGGISVDPKNLSPAEMERLSRAYIDQVADFIGPDTDIPAPDVNTNPRVMGWMMDQYRIINRAEVRDVITGKPVEMGGSEGRTTATGDGAFHTLQTMMARWDRDAEGTTVAVQGFGNAGQQFARLCADAGYTVVAVSDSGGGIYDENGLDIDAVAKAKQSDGSVTAADGEQISNDDLIALKVDVLAPAALENVITEDNAADIQSGVIVEIANGPVASEADATLVKNGVQVLPDILANAGGVTVSYFEWVKNLSHIRFGRMQRRQEESRHQLVVDELERLDHMLGDAWSLTPSFKEKYLRGADELELVRSGLDDTMRIAYQSMREVWHGREDVSDLRTAAFIVAIDRVASSYRAKGL